MRALAMVFLFACSGGSDSSPAGGATTLAFCEGPTQHRYDPDVSTELEQWPDDHWSFDDPSSPTGQRIALEGAPWASALSATLVPLAEQLEGGTGFATQGRIVMRFSAPLAEPSLDADASLVSDALQLFDLSELPPARVPYSATLEDGGTQLRVQPLRPLRPGARHVLIATRSLSAADGGCVAPSPRLEQLLRGSGEPRLVSRYADALEASGVEPDQVSAATVWTTHRDHEGFLAAAEAVLGASHSWERRPVCVDVGDWLECDGAYRATDFRSSDGAVRSAEASGAWSLETRVLLPHGEGPFPTLIFGHGLSSSRTNVGSIMPQIADLGVAIVAVDALHHGAHPTAEEGGIEALPFLGLDLVDFTFDTPGLRGSFEQTTLDRLTLVELLAAEPDLDGDGRPELDPSRMGYVGVSLGGILGPQLLAVSDRLQVATLWISGGHLIEFSLGMETIAPFVPLLESMAGGEAALQRLLPVAQASIDAADSALWAALATGERPLGGMVPDILLPVSVVDDTVPPAAGRALARALEAHHVEQVVEPVDGLQTAAASMTANHASGATVGYFQYDRLTNGGIVEPSGHANTPWREESTLQLRAWLTSWLEQGQAEAVDPYAILGTPPL